MVPIGVTVVCDSEGGFLRGAKDSAPTQPNMQIFETYPRSNNSSTGATDSIPLKVFGSSMSWMWEMPSRA
jgi:hypothetical protein